MLLAPHHGLGHGAFVLGDPQPRQHLLFATLVTGGGMPELLDRAGQLKPAAGPASDPLPLRGSG